MILRLPNARCAALPRSHAPMSEDLESHPVRKSKYMLAPSLCFGFLRVSTRDGMTRLKAVLRRSVLNNTTVNSGPTGRTTDV